MDKTLRILGRPVFAVLDLVLDGLDWVARNCVHIRWEGISDHSHPLDDPQDSLF
jgi:hypothetical protein